MPIEDAGGGGVDDRCWRPAADTAAGKELPLYVLTMFAAAELMRISMYKHITKPPLGGGQRLKDERVYDMK